MASVGRFARSRGVLLVAPGVGELANEFFENILLSPFLTSPDMFAIETFAQPS